MRKEQVLIRIECVFILEWCGMDVVMVKKCLNVLVKKGKVELIGQGDEMGIKFI